MTPADIDPALALRVLAIRGQRVVLDSDLAKLYEVQVKVFNQTIRRYAGRFPRDFAFQLTRDEVANLKSQIVTSSSPPSGAIFGGYGGARKLPWVFTEHGAIMAATILRSERAVAMSVYIVRAFVRMREELATSAVILKRLAEIDKKLLMHDAVLRDIYDKIMPLLEPPPDPSRKELGFHAGMKKP
jgi:hypothetical protein